MRYRIEKKTAKKEHLETIKAFQKYKTKVKNTISLNSARKISWA